MAESILREGDRVTGSGVVRDGQVVWSDESVAVAIPALTVGDRVSWHPNGATAREYGRVLALDADVDSPARVYVWIRQDTKWPRITMLASEVRREGGHPHPEALPAGAVRALRFALTIDDHFDRREFLEAYLGGDTAEWPDFAAAEAPTAPSHAETFASIAAWAESTFGPILPARIVGRADEEMVELRADPESVEEAADVVICLARYPDLWTVVERKMAVNRQRRWRRVGDGTGYHIKPGAGPDSDGAA